MDVLSRELQNFLVSMSYKGTDHQTEHMMEHLFALLPPKDEEAIIHYFGLFGTERQALSDIAKERNEEPETTMTVIDHCIRQIAVTPEWQTIKGNIGKK